jgi:aminoglycoside phosphotransferase (APT) family kinase protein
VTDEDIVLALLDYLRAATACPSLSYREPPTRMRGGFDATILSFSLRGAPDKFSGPLVLRLFQPTVDPNRATREAAVQNAVAQMDFPAPRVFVAEVRVEPLGGAFLIMQRMPGRPLGAEFEGLRIKGLGQALNFVRQVPRIRRRTLRLWDEAQTRLHALPVSGFVDRLEQAGFSAGGLSFDSDFANQRAAVDELGLTHLRPLVDWLIANRPPSQTAVVCHGDFQPLNVLADNGRLTGVIDWVKATIAEPAFDYGAMIAILATVPIRAPAGVNQALRVLLSNLARTHSRRCRSTPGGEAALRYYQVFNCLVQLVTVGKSRARGNMTQGAYNSAVGVANLSNHVHRLTGIAMGSF